MEVANLTLERSGRRIVFGLAKAHPWLNREAPYLDLMLEGEEVAVLQRILLLERQEVMRVPVRASFEFGGQFHTGDAELTILDDRRALVSLTEVSPIQSEPSRLLGSV